MNYRAFIATGCLLLSNSFASVDLYSQIKIVPELEELQPNEEASIQDFVAKISAMQRHHAQSSSDQKIKRAFHAKSHGCLKGTLTVEKQLPPHLSQGIFIPGSQYSTIARFSNGKGSIESDSSLDVKGFAMKLLNVPGERLLKIPHADNTSMDFTMTNNPTPLADTISEFVSLGEKFAKAEEEGKTLATMPPEEVKNLIANDKILKILINRLVKRKVSTLVTETFWSGSPYLYGHDAQGAPQAAKWNITPCDKEYTTNPDLKDPDFLRKDLIFYLSKQALCYNLNVQIQNNKSTQPIEHHLTEWQESETPSIKIATLIFEGSKNKLTEQELEKEESCENLSFNPWNGVKDHQPLGNMNRARGEIYLFSSIYRQNDASFKKGLIEQHK